MVFRIGEFGRGLFNLFFIEGHEDFFRFVVKSTVLNIFVLVFVYLCILLVEIEVL